MTYPHLAIHPDVARALNQGRPVVALESTIIAHGLPRPDNLACARMLETTVRNAGVTPATIAIAGGKIKIGLTDQELQRFADSDNIAKVSRRDIAAVLASGGDGATTVAATMICAAIAGIQVFATGGIGGVHRGAEASLDISADLSELGRTPIAVVCAGAKSILDLPKTLEVLESWGVPVLGFGTGSFPAFYVRATELPVDRQVNSAVEAARIIKLQHELGLANGLVIAVPVPQEHALSRNEVETWISAALGEAQNAGITGKAITPFVLSRINTLSEGRALQANLALVNNNVRIAADIAKALTQEG